MNREKAWELVQARCDWALQRHMAHVAESMEALAEHLGYEEQKEIWYITGLLHDIDWNDTIHNTSDHCGPETMQYLEDQGVDEDIRVAIQTHHDIFGLPIDTDMKKALVASDEISGFAVAVALMRPTKMIGITPKSITKKIKDRSFAEAVHRESLLYCEKYLEIELNDFLNILIPAWEKIAQDWKLA